MPVLFPRVRRRRLLRLRKPTVEAICSGRTRIVVAVNWEFTFERLYFNPWDTIRVYLDDRFVGVLMRAERPVVVPVKRGEYSLQLRGGDRGERILFETSVVAQSGRTTYVAVEPLKGFFSGRRRPLALSAIVSQDDVARSRVLRRYRLTISDRDGASPARWWGFGDAAGGDPST
jgi:hypothetical protein